MKYLNISDFLQQSIYIWFELIVENALTLHITVTCQSLSGSLLAFSCILFNESAENKFVRGMVTKFIAVRGAQQDIDIDLTVIRLLGRFAMLCEA